MDAGAVLQRVDHIGHHRAGGGELAGPLAVKDHIPQHIAPHEHGVEHVVHAGQLVGVGHQHGLHAGGHPAFRQFPVPGDELDHAFQPFGGPDVRHRDAADAPGRDVVRVKRMAAGQRAENGDLAAGIPAIHIVPGVLGLGIAQLLGYAQRLGEFHVFPLHLGEHEVGGAVDDALDAADVVGRQALVHRGDDGGAAADAGFKQEGRPMRSGQSQQLGTIGGHHLLVGGADAAAAFQAAPHIGIGETGAADGLHHHADLRVRQDHVQVLHKKCGVRRGGKVPDVQDVLDLHRFTGAAGNGGGVAAANFQHTAAHRAKPEDRYFCHILFLPLTFPQQPAGSGAPVDIHHIGLPGQAEQHLLHRHLHGTGAHRDLHLSGAVFRP